MNLAADGLRLSATDLASFLGCRHRTALEMGVAHGARQRPHWHDPLREILFERGLEHERAYVESLRAQGLQLVDLRDLRDPTEALTLTLQAMRAGVDAVVQAALARGHWFGRPDVLLRVDTGSTLGAWSYEVVDTKLARETRAGTMLQLSLYSDLLGHAQGLVPARFTVVTPDPVAPVQTFRTEDYAAHYRWVCTRLEAFVLQDHDRAAAAHYPEPVEHCEVCAWAAQCSRRRRADDHLALVAGISRLQRDELVRQSVATLTALAGLPLPIPFEPRRGSTDALGRVREQARLQLQSRGLLFPLHELRPVEAERGLLLLPELSPGDVFLDLEGDSFAREGGREYLFGVVTIDDTGRPVYRAFWALDDAGERRAFEAVMDLVLQSWAAHPGMHVYHYAPYEPSAFKRLMGRYASREDELDRLLRGGRFVDLYQVVRQALLAGIERYSIKNLEVFYGFDRLVPLADASVSLVAMEQALELGRSREVPQAVRDTVEGYNRDDCVSALRLRVWLESLRASLEASGTPVPRPLPRSGDASAKVDARTERVEALRGRLLAGIPEDPTQRSAEQKAQWLLAYLLDWHRREDKAGWWEYFRLRDLPEDELYDEPHAVAGLELEEHRGPWTSKKTGKTTTSIVDRYRYPVQEIELRVGDTLKLGSEDKTFGDIVAMDRLARTIDVKKGPTTAAIHPASAFAHTQVDVTGLEAALCAIGDAVADGGIGRAAGVARDLLLASAPRLRAGMLAPTPGESALDRAVRVGTTLDDSLLAIQGPPGAGKTYTGARMIAALVAQGRSVGVAATSHKVIDNLLTAVRAAAAERGLNVALGHKDDEAGSAVGVEYIDGNAKALAAVQTRRVDVLGGTQWLWGRPEFASAVDVLFVDEAGQMSLANVLALSRAARSVVLLGDPQQLEQPRKGSHPDGVSVSALEHMLGGLQTVPEDRGIFLPMTWRLAPSITALTSELFYEGRLRSKPGLEHQRLGGTDAVDGSGLWLLAVEHDGNQNASAEEVDAVASLVDCLLAPAAHWVDEHGKASTMTGSDVLVVAPYNAQVSRLAERLAPRGVRVGTVDKFQGQEAAVVIYSMATSRPEDAPRGMEFLYSPNRLNVATSRARCAVILVASPRLFAADCRTPRQMHLANAFCRYAEMARPLPAEPGLHSGHTKSTR